MHNNIKFCHSHTHIIHTEKKRAHSEETHSLMGIDKIIGALLVYSIPK